MAPGLDKFDLLLEVVLYFVRVPSRQSGSAVKHFDSPVKLDVRKQILTALTGPYSADCHCQC